MINKHLNLNDIIEQNKYYNIIILLLYYYIL